MATKREQMNALMEEMRTAENIAMAEARELFVSEDMVTFAAKMNEFRDQTIPGSHFDQLFGALINVVTSVTTALNQTFSGAPAVGPFPTPAPVEPA